MKIAAIVVAIVVIIPIAIGVAWLRLYTNRKKD
jgi:hypothetical protein